MHDILNLAGSNLLSPPVLFLALGFAASFARSDLEVPQAVAKALSLYLLLAIEFKKFYMDEWSGLGDPVQIQAIRHALASTIPGIKDSLASL